MSENPVSNPEEGESSPYIGSSSASKSPGATAERLDKKVELKNSSEFKNSKEKDDVNSTSHSRRSSKECEQVEGVLDETAQSPMQRATKSVRSEAPEVSKVEEILVDPKTSMTEEAEENLEINQTSSTVSGCRSEDSELGIAGPATAAENVLHDDELLDPPKDQAETVAEWMERSSLHDTKNTLKNSKELSVQPATTATRKSQRIVTNIIKRSIKCLNKMHAMECASSPGNKTVNDKKDDTTTGDSPKVPQNRQNGAALPEETTTPASVTTGRVKVERLANSLVKKERQSDDEDCNQVKKKSRTVASKETRKRRSTDETSFSTNGNPKRICFEQRERFIDSLVGCDRITAEELATRADELRAEVQALDELARAKEMEWNEILSMRKLKEEAYLRVERKRQVMGYLENNNGQISDSLPPASLSLMPEWAESHREASQERRAQETPSATEVIHDERVNSRSRIEASREDSQTMEEDISPAISKGDDEVANLSQKSSRNSSGMSSKHNQQQLIDGRKQRRSAAEQNLDNRQIGEGRQGPIVDVRSIIADYRLRHPETVPRRGRRMRNSVNVNLGAGGAMVETSHGDSRPSSTDSCKSNSNIGDVNNPMSFKDVLVQFAKLSQQQGEPVKTPQNYPDVTLHPVAPTSVTINPAAPTQQTGSLLHGILTKNQTPRPTTFSPTLARLLTAPERERNSAATAAVMSQQITHGQNLLQAYQGTNPVSISDLLSSSKARTEITITPVVNTQMPSTHLNNVVHVDDVEEDNSLIDERDTRRGSSARDNREDRDTPPRCQGCHDRAAQFVCAGCGNQWYCSRECQVSAWDEHSEVCSG
ncbi:uncharacterized protein LOC103572158 isoform X1 [Microplitis demolitor]|uniref:uncharacterized protein LOC103572158 isoform X1 n=1 Tax=Microplitis demolitor TaxID=69319 RepID=UPI0004CD405E|nr:uncharacterized protein LOC103572158 isoform X1 [Microplitis demolitor]